MTEEANVTMGQGATPQAAPAAPEVNTAPETQSQPQEAPAQNTAESSAVDNTNEQATPAGDVQGNDVPQTPAEPSVDELKAKIKEYEIRDEEERLIREKLGIQDIDPQAYNYMNIEQQVINQGKQEYLKLCNDYGVNADPDQMGKSLEALRQTDPAKAYEFQRRFENLTDQVAGKRQMIQQQTAVYEVNKFQNDYSQLLSASPALTNVMSEYIQSYGGNPTNMYGQLQGVMDIILPVYQEAFNAGKQYSMEESARKNTAPVQGGIATANTQVYSAPGGAFTREQIAHMTTEEFAKNEAAIRQQMAEGKIL